MTDPFAIPVDLSAVDFDLLLKEVGRRLALDFLDQQDDEDRELVENQDLMAIQERLNDLADVFEVQERAVSVALDYVSMHAF